MTGTERSALRLALGMLRWNVAAGRVEPHELSWKAWVECEAEAFPGDFPGDFCSPLFVADDLRDTVPWRILRARLALYIRAVLRCEALGWDWWEMTHGVEVGFPGAAYVGAARAHHGHVPFFVGSRLARPLWLDARGVER